MTDLVLTVDKLNRLKPYQQALEIAKDKNVNLLPFLRILFKEGYSPTDTIYKETNDPLEFMANQHSWHWCLLEGTMKSSEDKEWNLRVPQTTANYSKEGIIINRYNPDFKLLVEFRTFTENFLSEIESPTFINEELRQQRYDTTLKNIVKNKDTYRSILCRNEGMRFISALLIRYPELTKLTTTGVELIESSLSLCINGTKKWLARKGIKINERFTFIDGLKSVQDGNPWDYNIIYAAVYKACAFYDLSDLSFYHEKDEQKIDEFLNKLRNTPYSNPEYGKPLNEARERENTEFLWFYLEVNCDDLDD